MPRIMGFLSWTGGRTGGLSWGVWVGRPEGNAGLGGGQGGIGDGWGCAVEGRKAGYAADEKRLSEEGAIWNAVS